MLMTTKVNLILKEKEGLKGRLLKFIYAMGSVGCVLIRGASASSVLSALSEP